MCLKREFNILYNYPLINIILTVNKVHFCSAAHQPTRLEVLPGSHSIRHTHTQSVRIFGKNAQLVTQTATYTTHSKHTRRTSMPSAEFEPAIAAIKRLQTRALAQPPTSARHAIRVSDTNMPVECTSILATETHLTS